MRELFKRAPRPEALRPLLLAFERFAYAAHSPTEEEFAQAKAAAARFRVPEAAAA